MVFCNFALVALAFALPALWLNPLSVMVAILLLGGRQLGLAVIYHDCSHSVFFRTRWLNEMIGHWVAGGLLNTSMYAYRNYHLKHHRFAGTVDDPDLALANSYPASKASLKRKFMRDITGRTGLKTTWAQLKRVRPVRNAPFLLSHLVRGFHLRPVAHEAVQLACARSQAVVAALRCDERTILDQAPQGYAYAPGIHVEQAPGRDEVAGGQRAAGSGIHERENQFAG